MLAARAPGIQHPRAKSFFSYNGRHPAHGDVVLLGESLASFTPFVSCADLKITLPIKTRHAAILHLISQPHPQAAHTVLPSSISTIRQSWVTPFQAANASVRTSLEPQLLQAGMALRLGSSVRFGGFIFLSPLV
jgi:hypothetical protein